MSAITYYAVLPFVRDEEDNLCPAEAVECHSPASAAARARGLAAAKAGAVAFSRTGDPDIGEFSDAVIIAKVGDVPADLELASSCDTAAGSLPSNRKAISNKGLDKAAAVNSGATELYSSQGTTNRQ